MNILWYQSRLYVTDLRFPWQWISNLMCVCVCVCVCVRARACAAALGYEEEELMPSSANGALWVACGVTQDKWGNRSVHLRNKSGHLKNRLLQFDLHHAHTHSRQENIIQHTQAHTHTQTHIHTHTRPVCLKDTDHLRIIFNSCKNTQKKVAGGCHQWTLIVCVVPLIKKQFTYSCVAVIERLATLVKMLW